MHNSGYKSALARRACRYSDARLPRKTDGILLESELPPRMRGKDRGREVLHRHGKITPAYAGKSGHKRRLQSDRWDHPRVCGEKFLPSPKLMASLGSPPHMRGKVTQWLAGIRIVGITPAYAGKSRSVSWTPTVVRDHPRVCGEKFQSPATACNRLGSPPRMRGKDQSEFSYPPGCGITPAYAGKSWIYCPS